MSKKPKRTRITAPKTAAVKLTIRPVTRHKGNSVWVTYLVQGWRENDKWQRRQFKEEAEAQSFAALKQVEMENKGRAQRMILSSLTQEHHDAAVSAIERLGSAYSLAEAVEFFLKHHRPPEFTIRLRAASKLFLDEKERDGLRPRTQKALKASIERFIKAVDDPWTHEVTLGGVEPDDLRLAGEPGAINQIEIARQQRLSCRETAEPAAAVAVRALHQRKM